MQAQAAPAARETHQLSTEKLYDQLQDSADDSRVSTGNPATNGADMRHRQQVEGTSHPSRHSLEQHNIEGQEEMSDFEEHSRSKPVQSMEQHRSSPYHPGLAGRSASSFANSTSQSSIFASSQIASRPSTSTLYPATQNPNGPSKHLITVLPPAVIPHDPPHPRTSPFASGYGPPQNFKRGVLVPLYPTLSGQLAAIAREYGLPSTGGIVLYLLETSNAMITNGMSEAFVGGPRISEEAWALLWARLFQAEAMDAAFNESLLADSQRTEQEYYEEDIPPVPAIPRGHQNRQQKRAQYSEEDAAPLSAPLSDDSSPEGTDSAYSVQADGYNAPPSNASAKFRRDQRQSRSASPSLGPNIQRPPSASSNRFIPRPSSQYSGSSSPNLRNLDRSQMRNPRWTSGMSTSQSFSARPSTSHSNHSAGFGQRQSLLGEGPSYSSSVIVGKVEFDIDRRRGGSRWFDTYMDQAAQGPGTPASASKRFVQANESVDFGHGQPRDSLLSKEYNRSRDHLSRPSIDASGRQELFLPTMLRTRTNNASDLSLDSASGESSVRERRISEESEQRTAILPPEPAVITQISSDETVPVKQSTPDADALSDSSRHSSASGTSRRRSASPGSGMSSIAASESDPTGNIGYALLQGDADEAQHVDQETESISSDDESKKSTAQIPQLADFSSSMAGRDPLSDVFGSDERAWSTMKNSSESETAGLGILGSTALPSISHQDEPQEQDDIQEVQQMLEERHLGGQQQQQVPQLSSPISLDVATMEQTPAAGSDFMAALNTGSPPITTPSEETDDPMGIMITRQSPTDAASSRAQSMMRSSSNHSLSSFTSPPVDLSQAYELSEETIPEAEEAVDYSQVRSQAESSGMIARLQNNHPGYIEDSPGGASRRSSIDMHNDLDDLERALAELSPRGKKPGSMSPSFSNRSSPFGTPTSSARPLRMYDRRHTNRTNAPEHPGVALVADIPGYNQSPTESPVTSSGQEAAQSQAASQRELPPLVTDESSAPTTTVQAAPQQASEPQDPASLAALSFSPPRSSSLASKNRSVPSAMQALVPLPPFQDHQTSRIHSTNDETVSATEEEQEQPQPLLRNEQEDDNVRPKSPGNLPPVENTALAYLTSDPTALSPPSDTASSSSKRSPKSPKGLNFGGLRIAKPWSDRSTEKNNTANLSSSQGQAPNLASSVRSDDDGGQKSPGSFSKFKFWQRQDSFETPQGATEAPPRPPPVPERLEPDGRRSSESFHSHNSPSLPPETSPAESNFSQNSYNSGNAYLYTNPQSLHPDYNDTEEQYKNIPDARSPSPRENRRYGFTSNPTSPVLEEFESSDDEQRRTAAQRFYDSDRSSILSQEEVKPERQESAVV